MGVGTNRLNLTQKRRRARRCNSGQARRRSDLRDNPGPASHCADALGLTVSIAAISRLTRISRISRIPPNPDSSQAIFHVQLFRSSRHRP